MEDEVSMLATLFKQRAGLKPHARAAAALILVFAATLAPEANAAGAPGPFSHLAGSWSGAGTITTSSGTRERIRCVATYRVGEAGHALEQDLRCASDSYKFNVISVVRTEGGRLSGTWSETSRNVSGDVSGSVSESQILATVTGTGFSAGLALITRGTSQSVTIRPSGGTDVVEVAVNMRKG
jgi:hypothetical protein